MSPEPRPSAAEQARTAMDLARVACLTTWPRTAPSRPHLTSVVVRADELGRPVVVLAPDALAAAHLRARPLATVHVAPPAAVAVTLHGMARRVGDDGDGRWRFRVEVGAVRVGERVLLAVDADDYRAARPDPLRGEAPRVLRHLAQCHAPQLLACLRARGTDAVFVEPRALDALGLDVVAVRADGVELVRLAFPEPVARLADLRTGLAAPLLCRCGEGRVRA